MTASLDVGKNCTFHNLAVNRPSLGSDDLIITPCSKDGKAVAFDYRVPFVNALSAGDQASALEKL